MKISETNIKIYHGIPVKNGYISFEFIIDDRLTKGDKTIKGMKKQLEKYDKELKEKLKMTEKTDNIIFIDVEGEMRELQFKSETKDIFQIRKNYEIMRTGKVTYNDIYAIVNSVKVCSFQKNGKNV